MSLEKPGSLQDFAEVRGMAADPIRALRPYTQVLRRHRASLAAAQGITSEQLHASNGQATSVIEGERGPVLSDGQATVVVEGEFGPVLERSAPDGRRLLALRPTTHAEHKVIMDRFRTLATGPGVNGNAQNLLDLAASDIEMSEAWAQANQPA